MDKAHDVQRVTFSGTTMLVRVDGKEYWTNITKESGRLAKATQEQRENFEVSPAGYGIHWPDLDEDLSYSFRWFRALHRAGSARRVGPSPTYGLRRHVRVALATDSGGEVLPHLREISNVWTMGKDGKRYFDPHRSPKEMRKYCDRGRGGGTMRGGSSTACGSTTAAMPKTSRATWAGSRTLASPARAGCAGIRAGTWGSAHFRSAGRSSVTPSGR